MYFSFLKVPYTSKYLLVIIINASDQISKAFKIMWRHFVKEVSKDPFFNVVFPIKEGI